MEATISTSLKDIEDKNDNNILGEKISTTIKIADKQPASSNDTKTCDEIIYICEKQTRQHNRQHIRLPATSFRDLAHHSNVFVDKTLLIKSVLENESILSLTYPSKWGKTIAMDMMKEFFEIQVTSDDFVVENEDSWASNFFKFGHIVHENGVFDDLKTPPRIAQDADILKHLGQYPVIHIDLSTIEPLTNTFQGFFLAFRRAISAVYKKHDHIANTLQKIIDCNQPIRNTSVAKIEQYLKTFQKFLAQTEKSGEELCHSLLHLCEILHWRYQRKILLLVDNYDAWVRRIYSRINDERIHNFYSNFMGKTLADNDHIRNAVLTGTIGFRVCFPQSRLDHVTDYNLLEKNCCPYFGFTSTEVEQLVKYCDRSFLTARRWYGGYVLGDDDDSSELTIYNPWSIVNFANTGRTETYWCNSIEFNIFPQILKFKTLRGMFDRMSCIDGFFEVHQCRLALQTFGVLDLFSKMVNLLLKHEGPLSNDLNKIIIMVLYANGYITRYKKRPLHRRRENKLYVKLPNEEIQKEIINELKLSFSRSLLSALESAERIPDDLITFIKSKGTDTDVKLRLENDINDFRSQINMNATYNSRKNDSYIHLTPVLISLLMKSSCKDDEGVFWMLLENKDDLKPETLVCFNLENDCHITYKLADFYDDGKRLKIEWRDCDNDYDVDEIPYSYNTACRISG